MNVDHRLYPLLPRVNERVDVIRVIGKQGMYFSCLVTGVEVFEEQSGNGVYVIRAWFESPRGSTVMVDKAFQMTMRTRSPRDVRFSDVRRAVHERIAGAVAWREMQK